MRLESTRESRCKHSVILLETGELNKYVGGVILSKEAVGRNRRTRMIFTEMLQKNGIVSSVNVSGRLHSFCESAPGEEITCQHERLRGAHTVLLQAGLPLLQVVGGYSRQNWNVLEPLIQFNTDTQSRLSLSGLVSIVEPHVMLGGTLGAEMWESVFTVLHHHGVIRKGMFLKSSIVFARFEWGVKC
ncbi:Fructose-bisphosphate aldolase class-I, putative [Leishmania guyanensis]|nr:fructose biphosphate aldolase (pseudogene),putative [Leishmania guyanensis]